MVMEIHSPSSVVHSSDDLIYQKYRYIVFDINILYHIASSKKNIEFLIYYDIFYVSRYSSCIAIFTLNFYIFLLSHCQNNDNKWIK